jgi:hypothetical protein
MATERLSPGVYRVNGKTVRANNAAQAEQMAGGGKKAGSGKNGKAPKTALTKKQQARVNREFEVGKKTQAQNITGLNANVSTPFSNTTTTIDPVTGQATQTTSMSGTEQAKYDAGSALNQQGLDAANAQFGDVYGQPWQFGSGDAEAERARIEDAAYSRLTRGNDARMQQEKADLEQTLANRGIPLDPNDPQYQRHMNNFNQKWDESNAAARQQATMLGGQEYQREYDIASGQHNIQTGDLAGMQQQGTGFMVPNAPAYQGAQIENPSPSALDLGYGALKNQSKQVAAQMKAASRPPAAGYTPPEDTGFDS